MRRASLLGMVLVGCGWLQADGPQRTWTVQRGESLGGIAKRHDVSVAALRAANDLDGSLIHPGQVLIIPGAGPIPEAQAEPAPRRQRTRRPSETTADPGGDASPSLPPRPKAEPCLSGPTAEGLGDQGAAASEGLSASQVSAAVSAVMPYTGDCLVDGEVPSGTLMVSLQIGCDGLVSRATVAEDPGWPAPVTTCVLDVLRRADFPAHALPDGETVVQPVSW